MYAVVSTVSDKYHNYDTIVDVVLPTRKAAQQWATFCNRFEIPDHMAEDPNDDYGRYWGVFPVRL
jgi:hypothetical protein